MKERKKRQKDRDISKEQENVRERFTHISIERQRQTDRQDERMHERKRPIKREIYPVTVNDCVCESS